MGGYNSGGRNHNGRPSVESCININISQLKKKGALKQGVKGTLTFGRNSFGFEVIHDDMLSFNWHIKGETETHTQFVGFQWLAHNRNFGGHQTYFVCPSCFDCKSKLYFYRARFACRSCHRLQYKSQRQAKFWRLRGKLEKIAKKLGAIYEWGMDEAPERLTSMKQSTYRRFASIFESTAVKLEHLERQTFIRINSRFAKLK